MNYDQVALSCAFTGHRPTRFVFKDDETHTACVELKQVITRQIEHLYQCGIRRFYTGCALGVDMWAGEAVLSLAEQCPHIQLYSVVPFRGQEAEWMPDQQKRYHDLLKRSNSVFVLNEGFTKDCYLERNRFLVDQADVLLAVYDEKSKKRSGTGHTVNYAKKNGKPILFIDPDTFQVNVTATQIQKAGASGMVNKEELLRRMSKRILPAFIDNQQITSDNLEYKDVCVKLMSYKVLRALYEISQEEESGLTWDDCVKIMKSTRELLDAAVPVILYTMEDFISKDGFNFHATGGDLIEENEPGEKNGILRAVELFTDDYGEFLYDFFFLSAEVVFYYQQLSSGKGCSWKEYLTEIQEDRSMWDMILAAVHDGFRKMDFKVGWLAEDLEEVQFLHQPPKAEK